MMSASASDVDSVTQQRRAEETVARSFPVLASQVIHGPKLTPYENTPADLASEMASHNEVKAKICKQCKDAVATVRDAVHLRGDAADKLESVIDALKIKKLPLIKSIVEWYSTAHELSQRHYKALRPIADKLNDDADQVVAAVKVDLEKVGSGLGSMVANAHEQPDAAARQFDHIARCNTRSRAAIIKAQQAYSDVEAAGEAMNQLAIALAGAHKLLDKMAVEAVTSAI
jgi:hypothetical protein